MKAIKLKLKPINEIEEPVEFNLPIIGKDFNQRTNDRLKGNYTDTLIPTNRISKQNDHEERLQFICRT